MSSWTFNLKPGDKVRVFGPFGEFFAKETPAEMVFIGGGAGRQHSTGTSNIAIGRDSLNNVVTGTHNTAVGNRCFERITSGSHNCALTGLYGALFVSTGDYNNFFGSLAGYAYDQANATATGDHNNIFGGYSKSSANNNDHENIFGGGLTGKVRTQHSSKVLFIIQITHHHFLQLLMKELKRIL